jgi:hypothetical protein
MDSDAIPVPEKIELRRLNPGGVGGRRRPAGLLRHFGSGRSGSTEITIALHRPDRRKTIVPAVWSYPLGPQPFLVWRSARRVRSLDVHEDDFFGRIGRSQGEVRLVRPSAPMLDEFLSLADAPPRRILAYAKTWGVLGICKHGQPCTHTPFTSRRQLSPRVEDRCAPLGWDGRGGFEPIEAWRRYAELADATLRVAEQLRNRRAPNAQDLWVLMDRRGGQGPVPMPAESAADLQRIPWRILVAAVNRWIVDADLRPFVLPLDRLSGPVLRMRIGAPWWLGSPSWGLFGALGQEIVRRVSSTDVLNSWPCDGCGKLHARSRWPAQRRGCFCSPRCAARDRQRRHRDKRREEPPRSANR